MTTYQAQAEILERLSECDDLPVLPSYVFRPESEVKAALLAGASALRSAVSVIEELEKVKADIPTNWCDPLLSGRNKVIGQPPYGCPDIERLLRALRSKIDTRIAALRSTEKG